ncbi:uncharacterized protein LOC116716495 isoform X1 [Xiphophorus hellerii]|uniref:uncharacterized protein LOC116716495 isoform X1 n=1 Tax=Xiphophorus hellerii TaxID=8084 RepID=UPI0013B3E257|nr:uncharacterized protein LOC116716495 isoform X1 [Xiphophorus hellerii]
MASAVLLLLQLLLLTSLVSASHHWGGTTSFTYKGRNPDGSVKMSLRTRDTYDACYYNHYWYCYSSNCGHANTQVRTQIDTSTNTPSYKSQWCESETVETWTIPSDKPFNLRAASCCWISTRNSVINWNLDSQVDFGTRSDTRKPNKLPDIAIVPFLRVPENCPRTYRLAAFDPDGDRVRCRYGNNQGYECDNCQLPSGFQLDQDSCTLHYQYTNSDYRTFGFEMVVEDYARGTIDLFYSDGSSVRKYPLPSRTKRQAYTTTPPTTTNNLWSGWQPTTEPTTTTAAPTTTLWWWQTTTATEPTTTTAAPTTTWWWWTTTTTEPTTTTETAAPTTTWWWWTTTTTEPTTTTETAAPTTTWWWWTTTTTEPTTTTETAAPTTTWWWWTTTTTEPTTTTETAAPTTTWWWWTTTTTEPTTTTETAAPTTTWWWWTTTTTEPTTTTETAAPTTTWWWWTTTTTEPTTTTATAAPTTTPWWWWTTTTTAPTTTIAAPTTTPWWWQTTTTPTTTTPWWWRQTTTVPTTTTQSVSSTPLSKQPLQFSFLVDPPIPSCQEGLYLPKFESPTPSHGTRIKAEVNKEMEIRVKATAAYSSIQNIIFSGPTNVTKHRDTNNDFIIRWTPTEDDLGEQYPICFVVESVSWNSAYQSEMRCVLVEVQKHQIEATVTCTESAMKVEVDKASFFGLQENHLRLSDSSNTVCSLRRHSNHTHIVAIIPLNQCGTQIEEDDDYLIFKNEITTGSDDQNALITRKHLVEARFYCQYPKRGNVTLSFKVHRKTVTVWEKGFGTFTYQLEFYQDNQFGAMFSPNSYPLEYDVGDRIYMQLDASSSVNNTEMFVESCRAAPYDNPNYHPTYSIIENGCGVDPTVRTYTPSNDRQFQFSVEAFRFIGLHDQVYISCTVMMCEAGNPNTRCSLGCSNSTRSSSFSRRKREAVVQSGQHFVSQGPLRLKREADPRGASAVNLNLNLMFVAGCLLAAVGMVCGLIIYKTKTSRAKYQPLPAHEN